MPCLTRQKSEAWNAFVFSEIADAVLFPTIHQSSVECREVSKCIPQFAASPSNINKHLKKPPS